MHVVIVTATTLPQPDPDEPALVAALEARGAKVRVLAWDDSDADFSGDVAVVRSTWNYLAKRDAFCDWAERTERVTRLLNPASVLRENTDKIYLRALGEEGVPVVETRFVDRGADARAALEAEARRGTGDVVVKPRVSAGSFGTRRFQLRDELDAASTFLEEHLRARDMMVQPYQPAVDESGERSHVFIDGAFTHCMRKTPRFSGEPFRITGPFDPAPDETDLALRALARYGRLLYARVDLVRDETGAARLMELELTEPYLMLGAAPHALEKLAAAIVAR